MTDKTFHFLLRYGPAIVMTLLIPVLSLLPAHFFTQLPGPPPLPGMDKLVHAMLYAVLTATYLYAFAPACRSKLFVVLLIIVLATLYGIAMEVCQQLFTASRAMDPLDALANLSGVLATTLVFCAVYRYRQKRKAD